MIFCKKLGLYLLIFAFSLVGAGCNEKTSKDFFKVESKYDLVTQNNVKSSKPSRVGNIIYLGSDSAQTKSPNEVSFEFEDLKR